MYCEKGYKPGGHEEPCGYEQLQKAGDNEHGKGARFSSEKVSRASTRADNSSNARVRSRVCKPDHKQT